MSDYVTRAEFEAFKATLVPRGEFNGMERRLEVQEKSLKETRGIHFALKEDMRDWQADDQTDSELLSASLKPLFREDEKGIALITRLQSYPETKKRADKLWLIFKIVCGVGTAITVIVSLLSAIM